MAKVTIGSTLVFSVRSYTEDKKVKSYSSPVTLTVEVKLVTPVLIGKLSKSVGSLSWTKVTDAQRYEVYRSSTYAGTYTLVTTTVTLKFSEKLGVGVKAYYKIRSYITVNGKKVYSDYSNIVLITN
jgi:lactocepin